MRPLAESNRAYEKWLRGRLTLVSDDLRRKHEKRRPPCVGATPQQRKAILRDWKESRVCFSSLEN